MSRKSLFIVFAVIALVMVSAFVVAAQDDTDDTTPPTYGPGWMHQWNDGTFGPGMMRGRGFGMGMMWTDGQPMMYTVAEALGLEPDAFFAALSAGQTLADIAEAQGVDLQTVYDAMIAEAGEHMALMVEAGYITQAQADEHLAWVQENIGTMPMFSGAGFGPCMGGNTSFGPGMMGRGRGMWQGQ